MKNGRCREKHWWHGKFRGCGYRVTVAREAILDVLARTDKHMSAEDIYMKLHPIYPNIGLTTVYRTLDVLSNLALIFKLEIGDGRARYELAESPKKPSHHHHLVCTGCKKVVDYSDFIDQEVKLLQETEKGLSEKYNFKITNHLIQFYGLCSECLPRT
ncbi:MAG TPA: ferric uptake regulation protein [Lentisphaeria bacterium]|nr:MAG: ferric uptake regulation protein [Lentisphaerae bacterium GWF2_49_21]HBC89798.1 ferric uptake regulation protein [Lentisphaeria bacterium]